MGRLQSVPTVSWWGLPGAHSTKAHGGIPPSSSRYEHSIKDGGSSEISFPVLHVLPGISAKRFGDFILGFIRDVCDLQHNRGIGTRDAIASMRTQDEDPAGTKLPSADDGTTLPTVDADMPQADSGTDLSGDQLQAGTEPPSLEAGPLLEVTNTLGTRPSKRNRSQTMRYKQWLEG